MDIKKFLLGLICSIAVVGCNPSPGLFCREDKKDVCINVDFDTGVVETTNGIVLRKQFDKSDEWFPKCNYTAHFDIFGGFDMCAVITHNSITTTTNLPPGKGIENFHIWIRQ